MLLPTLYEDPVTEYEALLHYVTLWDVAVERCVEVRGPDAFDLVNLVTCRDLTKVEPMQARYVLLTAPWGGIVNDPVLLRLDRNRFWLALADSDALLYLAGVAGARGMDVSIFEADVAPMQIQGPHSKDVMRDLFGDAVADLRYYFCAEADVDGIPVVDQPDRMDGGGRIRALPPGHEPRRRPVRARVPGGGAARDPRDAPSEARRIEARIFNYGSDIRVEDTPLHVSGLERFVEWDQEADFLGRSRLEEIRDGDLLDCKLVGIDDRRRADDRRGRAQRLLAAGQGRRPARRRPPARGRPGLNATSATRGSRPLGGARLRSSRPRPRAAASWSRSRAAALRGPVQEHPEGLMHVGDLRIKRHGHAGFLPRALALRRTSPCMTLCTWRWRRRSELRW